MEASDAKRLKELEEESFRKYLYKDNKIINIEQRMWLDTYIEHYFIIETSPMLIINEKIDNGIIRIYPN